MSATKDRAGNVVTLPTGPTVRNTDAEQAVLGAILELGAIPPEVRATGLKPNDFTEDKRRSLYATMLDQDAAGRPLDVVSLKPRTGWDDLALYDLAQAVTVPTNAPHYAEQVVEARRRRDLHDRASRLAEAAMRPDTDPAELVAGFRAELGAIAVQDVTRHHAVMDLTTFAYGLAELPTAWGRGSQVLWSPGEPLLIVGPDGVGKTTLAQRLALARAGIGRPEVLGFPVAATTGRVLYVAADRPRQARRSLRRMVTTDEATEGAARERIVFWPGPLPFDIVNEPGRLVTWAEDLGASDLVLDSLGILVPNLASDETGSAIARAFAEAVAAGIEIVAVHHQRKASQGNEKPNKLADVYGSRWITSAAGSVLMLWGSAGDPVVSLAHLKQPADPVGPFQVSIDHEQGDLAVIAGTDLLGILRGAPNGMTAIDAAAHCEGASDKARQAKARRALDGFVSRGRAHKREPEDRGGHGAIKAPARYFATPPEGHQEPIA